MRNILSFLVLAIVSTAVQVHADSLSAADENMLTQSLQPLATIINTRNSDFATLSIILNGTTVTGLDFETQHANAPTDDVDFTAAQVESTDGIVLEQVDSYKALIVKGTVDSLNGNGSVTLSYLTNALTSHYADCQAGLTRDSSGTWHLVNITTNQLVDQITVKTSMFGISQIEDLCGAD